MLASTTFSIADRHTRALLNRVQLDSTHARATPTSHPPLNQTVVALQKQLSILTVEKMKLAQKAGILESENGQLRQKWLQHSKTYM